MQTTIQIDGHFGLQRLAKVDDPDDVSLLGGRGFFPPDKEYDEYVEQHVGTKTSKGGQKQGEEDDDLVRRFLSRSLVSEFEQPPRNRRVQISMPSKCKTNSNSRDVLSLVLSVFNVDDTPSFCQW